MKLALIAALTLATTVSAQTTRQTPHAASPSVPFTDPANLRGERVAPLTGRELPIDKGALGLQQLLRRLNTRASLMLIVAHPDDEDGGMLTFYSRGLGARVATLTLTRGEGGQNAMTGDFEDALGLIRTQELLSADRYFGASQMFGTEVDFGFSKTKEEAFSKWTHQRVLYDAVRAVRLYRPLVIASVFIGGVTDGHGQHQVSGEIAQEVFNAAGDPKVFPELTAEGILPWQPLKVYARVPMQAITPQGLFDYATGQYAPARFTNYVTGQVTTTEPSVNVVIHEGQTDPLLTYAAANPADIRTTPADPGTRLSYVQFARIGLGLQRSQIGPNVRVPPVGAFDIAYHRYGSRLKEQPEHEASFFDGIDTSIAGIATLAPDAPGLPRTLAALQDTIRETIQSFDPARPTNSAISLMALLREIDLTIRSIDLLPIDSTEKSNVLHELRTKRVQANDALALALGLQMDATTANADQIVGAEVEIPTRLTQHSTVTLPEVRESLENSVLQSSTPVRSFDNEGLVTATGSFAKNLAAQAPLTGIVTRPYFFRDSIEDPVYRISNPQLRLAPQTPPALVAWADLTLGPVSVRIGRVVHAGNQPVSLVPPASLSLSTHAQVLPDNSNSALFSAFLHPAETRITPKISVPAGWKISHPGRETDTPGQTDFQLIAPPGKRSPVTVKASVELPGHGAITEGFRAVGYPGIPFTNDFTPATDRIVPVDLKLPARRRIAYLPGTGDAVPGSLASIGLPVTMLTVADLTPANLSHFDTVVLGVRTYNAHPDLHGAPTQALLDFARNGGNVVVQYQTYEFTGADAPFPLTLGNAEKVVDETAPVELLQPNAPLFRSPNHISSADFNGWIEERGHGFLHSWDTHYTALTETHDPGGPETRPQLPQEGGLITTPLGRGHWTYCAFALYRQLPEAVPGAFRLFVNLLGLADSPAP